MKSIPINKNLLWDYAIPANAESNEAFRELYIKRVLTHGTADDIRNIGLSIIHKYIPRLFLPRDIREFWHWYFTLPVNRERYGDIDPIPETSS